MSNTDPGWCFEHKCWTTQCERRQHWCFEHKCWTTQCERRQHSWETPESFKARTDQRRHPECPSCHCPADMLLGRLA